MIQMNSDNARKTADVATSSHTSALRGKEVVETMIRAIQDINTSNDEISEIVKVIGEIENKTTIINDIVFQTRILSFNASIEAARAGEHGRGFAVVAEEVGKLAEMSGHAAKEISDLLAGSIRKVERLVTANKEKVGTGTQVASDCGGVLEEILLNVQSVKAMAEQISNASNEQAQGIQEITKAMNQLDQGTHQNAASSEQAATSSEGLSRQAESLRGVVTSLVVAVQGGVPLSASSLIVEESFASPLSGPVGGRTIMKPSFNAKLLQFKQVSAQREISPLGTGVSKIAVGANTFPPIDDNGSNDV
jgi:methyl-accepting chemotaxis protein